MPRRRADSNASSEVTSGVDGREQELGSMYDYLAKVILIGPSGTGKSCLLHRFVKDEWRVLSSQTIGVEFASKIVRIGTGRQRKRIKLQLWDTAGTERFRSVSRSYYRGAAGAILVYDITSYNTFKSLGTFLSDARTLGSPYLTLLLAGNKSDVAEPNFVGTEPQSVPASWSSRNPAPSINGSIGSSRAPGLGAQQTATVSGDGREVSTEEASRWANSQSVPVAVEVSAFTGENVDELFSRLARMILMKIELGDIDPGDPQSGVQYGDISSWEDGGSVKSVITVEDGHSTVRKRGRRRAGTSSGWQDWEDVFRLDNRRKRGCC